jgi:hypothetical protein
MEIDIFGLEYLVPSNLAFPFLAGMHFIQSHILPWAVGVFFATFMQSFETPKSRLRSIMSACFFVIFGIAVMPIFVALYSFVFGIEIHWSYGVSILSAYCLSCFCFSRSKNV